jgi:hypothetical protein
MRKSCKIRGSEIAKERGCLASFSLASEKNLAIKRHPTFFLYKRSKKCKVQFSKKKKFKT